MKKWNVYAAAVLAAVGILGGCGAKNAESQAPAETQAAEQSAQESSVEESRETSAEESKTETEKNGTLSVTYVKSPLNVPSIVELDQEIFASVFGPMGYDVQYSDLTTGPEQTQALASGDIQFLNAVGATSVILSASNDADIKIMSIYSRSPKAFKLFAGPKGTILHELLVAYLNNAGMTEDDIEFMAMGIPDAQAALAGGSVDAALLAGPTAYNMEKDGFYIVTDGEGLTEATIVTATSEKFYEEHPELVKAFLTAQKQVLDEMDADHAAAVSATAKATGLEEAAVEEMYGLYDFDMEIKDSDIEAMEKTEKFMEDTGMIENPVDVASLILDVE